MQELSYIYFFLTISFLRNQLAKRLLTQRSASDEMERLMISIDTICHFLSNLIPVIMSTISCTHTCISLQRDPCQLDRRTSALSSQDTLPSDRDNRKEHTERERERERERDTERETTREGEKHSDTKRERKRECDKESGRERGRKGERERERESNRVREIKRQKERGTGRKGEGLRNAGR